MKVAAAEFRDRPDTKREHDRQDIAVLERLRSAARANDRPAATEPPITRTGFLAMPLRVLADRSRRAALSAMLLFGAVVAGYVYFTSLYLQDVLHFSPLETGLAFIPATATVMLTSTQLTHLVLPRFGVRKILLAGLTIPGLGHVWLFTISNTGSYQLNVPGGIMVTAFGMGLTFPTISVAVTSGVRPGERGLVGGLFVTAQQVGNAIGLAALATIADAQTSAHHGSLVSGYKASFLVAIGFAVVAVLNVAIQMRTRTAPKVIA